MITSSDKAQNEGKNSFTSGGGIVVNDLVNTTSVDAQAVNVSVSVGTNGVGGSPTLPIKFSDSDDNVTRSGITGIAGNKDVRTDQIIAQTGQAAITPIATLGEIENNLGIVQGFATQLNTFYDRKNQEGDAMKKEIDALEKLLNNPELSEDERIAVLDRQIAVMTAYDDWDSTWGSSGTMTIAKNAILVGVTGGGGLQTMLTSAGASAALAFVTQENRDLADQFRNEDGTESVLSGGLRALLHGLSSCAAASATGGSCSAGSVSAGVTSLLGSVTEALIDGSELTPSQKTGLINFIKNLAMGITQATGGDFEAVRDSGIAAANEAGNNWLSYNQIQQMNRELAGTTLLEKPMVIAKWLGISLKMDAKTAYGAGKAFVEMGIETVQGMIDMITNPKAVLDGILAVVNDPSLLGKVAKDKVKEMQDLIHSMQNLAKNGNVQNAEKLGADFVKLFGHIQDMVDVFRGLPRLLNNLKTMGLKGFGGQVASLPDGTSIRVILDPKDQNVLYKKPGGEKDRVGNSSGGRDVGDSRLPIPESTKVKTKDGEEFILISNQKHTPGANGYRGNAGIEPRNSADIAQNSVIIINPNDNKPTIYGVDANGHVHRFANGNDGTFHWSGSTADIRNPLNISEKLKAQIQRKIPTSKLNKNI